jgi:TRAP-type C4-dicarboxylate transport system permease small subunit
MSEIKFGGPGLFGLRTWFWYLIFPVAFGLILLHFILDTIARLRKLLHFKQPETP